ncbi:YodC family protein [Paraburkholderia sp.]|uniref:YodC family protein n=1 Tax=Paraburkholderia sp. TaxID=1926495 RepID=UPI002F3EB179
MLTATLDAFDTPSVMLNVGDVVTLKTGGARMTVTFVGPVGLTSTDSGDNWLVCQWFDEHGELRQERFERNQVRVEPRSIPAGSVKLRAYSRVAHSS